jgi:hypothetical protein
MKHEMDVYVQSEQKMNEGNVYQYIEWQHVDEQSHRMRRNEQRCMMEV